MRIKKQDRLKAVGFPKPEFNSKLKHHTIPNIQKIHDPSNEYKSKNKIHETSIEV